MVVGGYTIRKQCLSAFSVSSSYWDLKPFGRTRCILWMLCRLCFYQWFVSCLLLPSLYVCIQTVYRSLIFSLCHSISLFLSLQSYSCVCVCVCVYRYIFFRVVPPCWGSSLGIRPERGPPRQCLDWLARCQYTVTVEICDVCVQARVSVSACLSVWLIIQSTIDWLNWLVTNDEQLTDCWLYCWQTIASLLIDYKLLTDSYLPTVSWRLTTHWHWMIIN